MNARKYTDEQLNEIEKRIAKAYKQASAELKDKWDKYMLRAETRLESYENELKKAKKSGDEKAIAEAEAKLRKAKQNVTFKSDWYKEMIDDTTVRLSRTNSIALSYVNDDLPNIYAANYNDAERAADQVGVAFSLVNEDTVKNLAKDGDIKLPYKNLDKVKDRLWNTRQLNSSVLQGILQGESMDKIAKRILPIVDNNKDAAIRNARTMVTGAENRGKLDSYERLEEQGVIQKKVWLATGDNRTRDSHLQLDGVEVGIHEEFLPNLEYPGDPNGDPSEVYNCRCALITHITGVRRADGTIRKIEYDPIVKSHEREIEREKERREE